MDDRFPIGGILVPTASLPNGRLQLANPEHQQAQRYGGPRAGKDIMPFIPGSYRHPTDPNWTLVPKGAMDAIGVTHAQTIWNSRAEAITEARVAPPLRFDGTLRVYQEEAVLKAMAVKHGVIVMPPGAGKTVTALALAHRLKLRPLVLVHTTDLMNQWIESSVKFFGVPLNQIGGGKVTSDSELGTVCMVQTLTKWHRLELERLSMCHGVLLVDECHHAPAETILKVLWNIGVPRRYGVSATPTRADGLTDLLYWVFGPIVHQVRTEDLVDAGVAVSPIVHRVPTGFEFEIQKQVKVSRGFSKWGKNIFWSKVKTNITALMADIHDVVHRAGRVVLRLVPENEARQLGKALENAGMQVEIQSDSKALADCYKALCEDKDRLTIIRDRVALRLSEGRKILILAGRVAYCLRICDYLRECGILSVVLTGQLSEGRRKTTLAAFKNSMVNVCIATSLADEGLDVPDISALVLAFPGRSEAKTIQRAGRTMRCVAGKVQPVIDDLVDELIPVFDAQWSARRAAYRKAGCQFETKQRRVKASPAASLF